MKNTTVPLKVSWCDKNNFPPGRFKPLYDGAILTWNSFTLVDVHALARVHVLEESGLARQVVGTLLAGVTPGLTDGGAAELLGANDTL